MMEVEDMFRALENMRRQATRTLAEGVADEGHAAALMDVVKSSEALSFLLMATSSQARMLRPTEEIIRSEVQRFLTLRGWTP